MTDKKDKVKKYVRTSAHTVKFANTGKLDTYHAFISEYRKVADVYIDFIWNSKQSFVDSKGITKTFDIENDKLDATSFFDYNSIPIPFETKLSARALSSLVTQCCGVVKAVTEKRRKLLWKRDKFIEDGKTISPKFLELIENVKLTKPKSEKLNPELSSKNIDFEEVNGEFNLFIRLKCLGDFEAICLPIKLHKQANKWKKISKMKGSVLLTNRDIQIRWEFEKPIKLEGITVGADQGITTVLSLSNKLVTKEKDSHGHSHESIMKRLSGKRKGSKSFRKTQDHRKNFINWSINSLDLSGIRYLNLEKISNLRFCKSTSRYMSHFVYSDIESKTQSRCEETGVQLNLQPSAFRSQRCSECGWVHYTNRNKKEFRCKCCGAALDADINAAINHEVELPFVPEWIMKSGLNRTSGFYWKLEGFFNLEGEELGVPLSRNEEINILI